MPARDWLELFVNRLMQELWPGQGYRFDTATLDDGPPLMAGDMIRILVPHREPFDDVGVVTDQGVIVRLQYAPR
jgi:hypothetical protein